MENNDKFRSKIRNAKGLGSAGTGTKTWLRQRISAILMLPLTWWFVYLVITISKSNYREIAEMISSPFNTILLVLFIFMGLFHGNIGMKEVIEDYIHCHKLKLSLIVFTNVLSLVTALSAGLAILTFHFSIFLVK